MRHTLLKIALIVFLSCFLSPAQAASESDLAKEKRWEEQIVDSIMVGEDIKLNADGVQFLALYAEATTDKAKGAIILLHGIGVHPAWPDVIEPLRTQLPDLGWHTLSLQMPILKSEATDADYPPLFPEVPSRIQAGVDYLKSKGVHNIVLSGHSTGATMALYYVATKKDPAVKAFAILGGGLGVPGNPLMDGLEHFKKIKDIDVSILDVYGSEDRKPVLDIVKTRKLLGSQRPVNRYQFLKIDGANHFYHDKEDALVNGLDNWLNRYLTYSQ